MNTKKIFLKCKESKSGITIIEIILTFSIIFILISITLPSMRRFIYKNERDNYITLIKSFLESIKRETRRYGISCTLKTIEIVDYPKNVDNQVGNVSPFQLSCSGDNNVKSNLNFQSPKISKNLFQRVSGDIIFTPKGQAFMRNLNNNNKSLVLAVGMKDSSLGTYDSMRCITINQPSALINDGTYKIKYNTSVSYSVSTYDNSLMDTFCSKD